MTRLTINSWLLAAVLYLFLCTDLPPAAAASNLTTPQQLTTLNKYENTKKYNLKLPQDSTIKIISLNSAERCDAARLVITRDEQTIASLSIWPSHGSTIFGEAYGREERSPLLEIAIPGGDYIIAISSDVTDQVQCNVLIQTNVDQIKETSGPHYGDEDVQKPSQLLRLTRRLIETNMLEHIELGSLRVTESPSWTGGTLREFLVEYCSANHTEEFGSDARTSAKKSTFFELSVDAYIHKNFPVDRVNYTRVSTRDIVCRADGINVDRLDIKKIGDILVSRMAVRYLVNVSISDAETKEESLPAYSREIAVATVIADALGVGVPQIALKYRQGNCSGTIVFASLTKVAFSNGSCLMSGSETIYIKTFAGGMRKTARQVAPSRVTLSLYDALSSVLPKGARVEWLQNETAAVRVKVSGVKGWVSPDSGYWERAFITAAVLGENSSAELLIVVDGSVCSGAGSIVPSEGNCLKSMDVVQGYNLNDFVSTLAVQVAAALTR